MRRKLVVTLPCDAYGELETRAERDERAVDQQATYLLKQLLLAEKVDDREATTSELAH